MIVPNDFPFVFECHRSGNCCSRPGGHVLLTDREVRQVAEFIDMSTESFRSRFMQAGADRLRDIEGTKCVFLEGGSEATCAIYPVRPAQCRTWPYWPAMKDVERARDAARFCPGIVMKDDDA